MGAGKSVKRLCPYGEEIRGLAVSLPVCRVIRNGGFWLLEASVGMTLSAGMHIRRGAASRHKGRASIHKQAGCGIIGGLSSFTGGFHGI